MKSKAIIPLAIGLAVGVIAIKLFVDIVKRAKGSTVASAVVPVVAAKIEIQQGTQITENMLTVKQIPSNLAPPDRFAKPQDAIDRVTSVMIPKEMPVLATMLAPKGTAPGLGAKIPDGMRAVAVKVDEWVGVGGWLKPGVRVDVAAVFTGTASGKSQTISKIILQNIEVLAVGGEKGHNPQDTGPVIARSVTLLVKPEDVGKIHLASEKGKIRLAMRNTLDAEDKQLTQDNESALLGEEKDGSQAAAQPAEPEQVAAASEVKCWRVDVVNGRNRERKVYRGVDSMEEVEDENGVESFSVQTQKPHQPVERPTQEEGPTAPSE
jgi:pilus assembly protein CpaB